MVVAIHVLLPTFIRETTTDRWQIDGILPRWPLAADVQRDIVHVHGGHAASLMVKDAEVEAYRPAGVVLGQVELGLLPAP